MLVGARPGLDPDDVKALLRSGARPLANTDASLQGAGVVDVAASAAMPEPRNARQRFQNARLGGWLRHAPRNQYAVENLKSNRWSSNRWTSNRWSSNRWTSNRWTSNRWTATAGPAIAGPATAGRASSGEGVRDEWMEMESRGLIVLSWGAFD